MEQDENPIVILNEDECWERLAQNNVARIATHVADVVDITPLNYIVDDSTLVFRTAAGNKLNELTINSSIVFETDQFDDERGWSVVVHGEAKVLETEREILEAEKLPLRPFVPTIKPVFVRIIPTRITGRIFRFGEEPRQEDQQDG